MGWQGPTGVGAIVFARDNNIYEALLASCTAGFGAVSKPLPRGNWALEGTFYLIPFGPGQTEGAAVRLELSETEAVALQLQGTARGSGSTVQLCRQTWSSGSQKWVCTADVETFGRWLIGDDDELSFTVSWKRPELSFDLRTSDRKETHALNLQSRPRKLALFVERGRAFFDAFVLRGS